MLKKKSQLVGGKNIRRRQDSTMLMEADSAAASNADSVPLPDQSGPQTSISDGPQNDYSYHFICTGERPANFIRDVGLGNRFEEYPKLRDLIKAKDELIQTTNTPPL